jgi:hypothetical protein
MPGLTPNWVLVRAPGTCDSRNIFRGLPTVKKKPKGKTNRKSSRLHKDRRRRHRHWQVTVYYHDGEKFARVYIDRDRAVKFAERQKKSPIVKATRILEVD